MCQYFSCELFYVSVLTYKMSEVLHFLIQIQYKAHSVQICEEVLEKRPKMYDGNDIPQKQNNWKLRELVFMGISHMAVWKSIITPGNTHRFPNCNGAGKLFTVIAVLSELGTLSKTVVTNQPPFKSCLYFLFFHKLKFYEKPSLIYNAQVSKSFSYSIFNVTCS